MTRAHSTVAGSFLSAPAATALATVGLEPAGEVMGCVVMHLGWTGQAGCGFYNRYNATTPIRIGGHYAPYMRALNDSYRLALERMTAESRALGAAGVVGVRLEWSRRERGARELLALGTAVRFRTAVRSGTQAPHQWPHFDTEMSGEQVATAILAGWHPVRIVSAVSLAVKHEDTTTKQFMSRIRTRRNVELAGLTSLVQAARRDSRTRLEHQADGLTSGQIVISTNDLQLRERPCGTEKDHLVESTLIGTALELDPGSTGQVEAPTVLSILPLRDGSAVKDSGNERRRTASE